MNPSHHADISTYRSLLCRTRSFTRVNDCILSMKWNRKLMGNSTTSSWANIETESFCPWGRSKKQCRCRQKNWWIFFAIHRACKNGSYFSRWLIFWILSVDRIEISGALDIEVWGLRILFNETCHGNVLKAGGLGAWLRYGHLFVNGSHVKVNLWDVCAAGWVGVQWGFWR